MVSISGAGKTRVFLSTPISARLCGLRSNARMSHQDVGRGCRQRVSGQRLPLGRDDLGVPFPLCFCLAGHRPLHALGQLNVLEIDQGDHLSPVGGLHVEDPLDVDVDPVSLGHRLIKAVLTDPLRRVVCAIWLIAAATFSTAITDFTMTQ